MNCPYCDKEMLKGSELYKVRNTYLICIHCPFVYYGEEKIMKLVKKNAWTDIPQGCLLVLNKYTEEVK